MRKHAVNDKGMSPTPSVAKIAFGICCAAVVLMLVLLVPSIGSQGGGVDPEPAGGPGEPEAAQAVISTGWQPAGGPSVSPTWHRDLLDDGDKAAYDAIEAGLRSMSEDISLPGEMEPAALERCFQAVLDDAPDIFWIEEEYEYLSTSSGNALSLQPIYDSGDRAQVQERADELAAKARSIVSGFDGDGYSRLRGIYGWIAANCSYDETAKDSQDIESVLSGGVSACAGYARTFQYLSGVAGIPCAYLSGPASSNGELVLHAWNASEIDGSIVYSDATWGDRDGTAPTDYSWLALPLDDMQKTHFADGQGDLPSGGDARDIWTVMATRFGEWDEGAVVGRMKASLAAHDECLPLRFGSQQASDAAIAALTEGNGVSAQLVSEFPDMFSDPVNSGVYAVYREDGLDAITVVWKY